VVLLIKPKEIITTLLKVFNLHHFRENSMPFYEYQCKACDHQLEELQKFSDPPLAQCPACGKKTLEKMISATGFQLTGSGWYETDFKDKKPQSFAESEKTANAQPEKAVENKTVEKKTEAQPDKKTQPKATEKKPSEVKSA